MKPTNGMREEEIMNEIKIQLNRIEWETVDNDILRTPTPNGWLVKYTGIYQIQDGGVWKLIPQFHMFEILDPYHKWLKDE